jgi:hypothetical protein
VTTDITGGKPTSSSGGRADKRLFMIEGAVPNNLIDMYHAVERFFAEHLGGRTSISRA